MQFSICVTTRNRFEDLDKCLAAIWNSSHPPDSVVVSDDSSTDENRDKTRAVVEKYPGTRYLLGSQRGACSNRNNALNATPDTDFVAFIDDDIFIEEDFIERALKRYADMPDEYAQKMILSGVGYDHEGIETRPTKLSFRGYFQPTDTPEAVDIHAAVFPSNFLQQEQWDENIFIGQEDAELCLRALRLGFEIMHCPELRVYDSGKLTSSLRQDSSVQLTEYDLYREACRLYVGVKRYRHLFPDSKKLVAFLLLYFIHMPIYLAKKGALHRFPQMISQANLHLVW